MTFNRMPQAMLPGSKLPMGTPGRLHRYMPNVMTVWFAIATKDANDSRNQAVDNVLEDDSRGLRDFGVGRLELVI